MENPKISVVTVSQLNRHKTLVLLKDMLEEQTFRKHIFEWVIVEGSKNIADAEENKKHIQKLSDSTTIKIKYIEFEEGAKLGRLRNKCNDAAEGDYIVCFDDDDYYFPQRLEHTITELSKSNKLIAGCQGIYIYDFYLNKQYFSGHVGETFSTNGCMAYKKEYLIDNRYKDSDEAGEESEFTKSFSRPMVQLDPNKIAIMTSHNVNTFNKREILIAGTLELHSHIRENDIIKMPKKYFDAYTNLFVDNTDSPYDIVYVCGFFVIQWMPTQNDLGGSEKAVVQLSEQWAHLGYSVAVYGTTKEIFHNGVNYFPMLNFPYNSNFKNLIVWRETGIFSVLNFSVQSKNILIDLHDNMVLSQTFNIHKKLLSKANQILLKSDYHLETYNKGLCFTLPENIYSIIPNGVQIDVFKKYTELERNPYRFCYCSCYTRGLVEILKYMWPVIFEAEPRAELHVYYGTNLVLNTEVLENIKKALLTPGVMNHDKQPIDIISREKHMSTFHLYINNSPLEIDCISIRESLVAGCIPLLADSGLYKERDGVHFDVDFSSEDKLKETFKEAANKIIKMMNLNKIVLDEKRNKLSQSKTITSWEQTAIEWTKHFI